MNVSDTKIIFRGVIIDVEQFKVEIGLKGYHTFQVVRHPGGAAVLPIHSDGSISLIRQLRPAVDAMLLEIPAGRLSSGELPENCARRELLEETGLRTERMIPLGLIHSSPGVFDEIIHLYAALELTQGEAAPEADEEIEVVRLSLNEALFMVSDDRISDAKTISALCRWQLREGEVL